MRLSLYKLLQADRTLLYIERREAGNMDTVLYVYVNINVSYMQSKAGELVLHTL